MKPALLACLGTETICSPKSDHFVDLIFGLRGVFDRTVCTLPPCDPLSNPHLPQPRHLRVDTLLVETEGTFS
jgi:hypothetical protein